MKLLFCILHLYSWAEEMATRCGNIKKRIICEAKTRTRLSDLKTCLRFPGLGFKTIIDSVKLTVLL